MDAITIIDALNIPSEALVNQRIPKKLLLEQGIPTAADKRLIREALAELFWVAALKSSTLGIPVYRDSLREYLEIAVLTASLRTLERLTRLTELLHRVIPYPVVLIVSDPETVSLSLIHKRWALSESEKTVLDGELDSVTFSGDILPSVEQDFLRAINLNNQPRDDLFALYQGWIDCLTALTAARITGHFQVPQSADEALSLREALKAYEQIQRSIALAHAQAEREPLIKRRVELNLELKRLKTELAAIEQTLRS